MEYHQLNKKTRQKIIQQSQGYYVQGEKVISLEGEDISHLYSSSLNPILSEKQIENYTSKQILGDHEKENGGFVFLFYKTLHNINELVHNLNKSEITRLLYLTSYISFETNQILYDNGRTIKDQELSKLLKLPKRQYNEYIKKLVNNNLLFIDGDNNKYISPAICKYGSINVKQLKKENISYIRLFKDTIRDLFESTAPRELGRLSTIYMILPYLNFATNIISHNPEEMNPKYVKAMTLEELSQLLGYSSYRKLKPILNTLKIGESNVFGFFLQENDKRAMKLVVNPNVVFAGNGEQLGAVKALFNK